MIRHRASASALTCVLFALPCLAVAQTDLQAELSATFAPVAINDNLTETLNCTALYRALGLLLGDDSDLAVTFREREGYMASVSGALWVTEAENADQTPEQVFEILLPPINAATGQYLGHMDALAASTDAPFDDLIIDGVAFCNGIYGALQSGEQ